MNHLSRPDNGTLPPVQADNIPEYNSTEKALKLPEYGRLVQKMIDHALTIEDRAERQHYAEAIVQVMMGLNEKMKDVPGFQHKTWDHLAYMADYKLDIDYPFEITKHDDAPAAPPKLSYPKSKIQFRHYGKLIEKALEQLQTMPEGAERDKLMRLIANRMKRNLADWKGDGVQDNKVARDIASYTDGQIDPDFSQPGAQLMQIGENRFRTRKNKGLI